ncbi:helix-turn-helix domain-containing protein [Streptomyces sp. SID6648]|nr:helix-turn-helix domain-containing protein [Streptomyces sp. SID6648]
MYQSQLLGRAEPVGPTGAAPLKETWRQQTAGEPLESLKRLLRRLRVEQGLSVGGLARRARLGRTTTSQALNGGTVPSEATLVSLAQALRTQADPLLRLRMLAGTAGNAVVTPVTARSERAARPPDRASGVPHSWETRFTYDYLDQRPTNLLRMLHERVRDSLLVGLRIRTVLVHRSVQADDPGLPALMVQCAEECHAFKNQIKSRGDGLEVMLLIVYLAVVFDERFRSDPAMADVYAEVYTAAIMFLAEFDIDSSLFLPLQGFLADETGGGIRAPWPLLSEFGRFVPDF